MGPFRYRLTLYGKRGVCSYVLPTYDIAVSTAEDLTRPGEPYDSAEIVHIPTDTVVLYLTRKDGRDNAYNNEYNGGVD